MRPTDCERCARLFAARPLLQAEALHVAGTMGDGAAASLVDERLGEEHAEHPC